MALFCHKASPTLSQSSKDVRLQGEPSFVLGAMDIVLSGPGQQVTFCRGVVAVSGERVEQASRRGLAAVPDSWVQQRQNRDGQHSHMTLLSKVDLQLLAQNVEKIWPGDVLPSADMSGIAAAVVALLDKASYAWDWVDVGTGTCKDTSGEATFRVVLWPAARGLREKLGLPPKDFHITLGFQGNDVHSKSKGLTSIAAPERECLPRLLAIPDLLETALDGAEFYGDEELEIEALRELCMLCGRRKQPQQLLAYAERLLQLRNDATAQRSCAFALVMLGRWKEALKALKMAELRLDEVSEELRELEAKRVTQAIQHCRKKLNVEESVKTCDGKSNYPKTPHLPFSPGVNSDDTRISDCEHLLRAEVVVTEKLDGGNCCLKSGQVFGRTHSQPATHESFSAVKELAATFLPELGDLQLFGENMQAVHSIEYGNLQGFFYAPGTPSVRCRPRL